MAQKALRTVIEGGLLLGLAIRADWLGFAIVLAGTAISLVADRHATRFAGRWVALQIAVSCMTWGVFMAGVVALLNAEKYEPLAALFFAALFGGLILLFGVGAHLAGARKNLKP